MIDSQWNQYKTTFQHQQEEEKKKEEEADDEEFFYHNSPQYTSSRSGGVNLKNASTQPRKVR